MAEEQFERSGRRSWSRPRDVGTAAQGDEDRRARLDLEALSAEEILAGAVEEHHLRMAALACSFQKEGTVLMHMLLRLVPDARIFTIDTGVLFPETYATWRELRRHMGASVEVLDAGSGEGQWTRERCCGERKVAALRRGLDRLDAWVTGLRREQAPTRAGTAKLEWDSAHELWKVNPLADWSEERVWDYIHEQVCRTTRCTTAAMPRLDVRRARVRASAARAAGRPGKDRMRPARGTKPELGGAAAPPRVAPRGSRKSAWG
jgi:phosphoadenosine phosphosulfate reductase